MSSSSAPDAYEDLHASSIEDFASLHASTSTMSSSLAPDDHKDLDANLFNHDDRVVTNNESSIEGKISNNLYVFIIIKCY